MRRHAATSVFLAVAACTSATTSPVGPGDVLLDASDGRPAIDIRDCATHAPPVVGRPLCARVRWTTDGWSSAVLNDVQVECALDNLMARASSPAGTWQATVELGPTTAGTHRAECRVDASDLVTEADERNNTRTISFDVLGGVEAWRYDVALEAIVRQLRAWKGPICDSARCRQFGVDVQVMNRGPLPIRSASVICEGGGHVFFGQAIDLAAGQRRTVTAWTTSSVEAEALALTCTAALGEPHGIPELHEGNNRREATVVRPGP